MKPIVQSGIQLPDTYYDTQKKEKKLARIKGLIVDLIRNNGIFSEEKILNTLSPKEKARQVAAEITVKRAIALLKMEQAIEEVPKHRLASYNVRNKDGRLKYFVIKGALGQHQLLSRILASIGSKDNAEQEIGLRELQERSGMTLTQAQLDQLVSIIKDKKTWNTETYTVALKIIDSNLRKGAIASPENLPTLKNALYQRYEAIKEPLIEIQSIQKITNLLALLEDKRAITIIKELLNKGVLEKHTDLFNGWEYSKIFLEHQTELYDLQIEVRNDKPKANAIMSLRRERETQYQSFKKAFTEIHEALHEAT